MEWRRRRWSGLWGFLMFWNEYHHFKRKFVGRYLNGKELLSASHPLQFNERQKTNLAFGESMKKLSLNSVPLVILSNICTLSHKSRIFEFRYQTSHHLFRVVKIIKISSVKSAQYKHECAELLRLKLYGCWWSTSFTHAIPDGTLLHILASSPFFPTV